MHSRGHERIPPCVGLLLPIVVWALVATSLGLSPSDAGAQERPGTLSIGLQGQYGMITGAGDFAELYNRGGGFAFRIRYALGGPQAFGISFENQSFGPEGNRVFEDTGREPVKLSFANATVEYLRYFNRGQGSSQYMTTGLGLYHPSDERRAGISPASDGLILLVGGGAEIFFLRATSIDISARANALLGDAVSATLEVAIGLHHYLVR